MDIVQRYSDAPRKTVSFGVVEEELRGRSTSQDCDEEEGKCEEAEYRGADDDDVSLPSGNDLIANAVRRDEERWNKSVDLQFAGKTLPERA